MTRRPDETRSRPRGPDRLPRAATLLGLVVLGLSLTGCSFIRFEKGPYVVRDLQVVYSKQENVTFLSWKLRRDAKVSLVEFELYRNGGYRTIDLSEAPFPADPWECGTDSICFQFQVPGRYPVPQYESPVRSRHVDEGVYAGPEPTVRTVAETFGIDPIAIARNQKIDPVRGSWFRRNDVPMRRDWQWQFVRRNAGAADPCTPADAEGWRPMEGTVPVDYGWVDRSVCLAVRPDRRDAPGTVVAEPVIPSAETRFGRQTYNPNKLEPPIVYGVLVDLVITSESRCKKVKNELLPTLKKAIQSQGEHRRLGIFKPTSRQTGQPLDGCNQEPGRTYPVNRMIRKARQVRARLRPPDVRVLWVDGNNTPVAPKKEIVSQLRRLLRELPRRHDLPVYNWAIGSNPIISSPAWDQTTGWRPVEDDTFFADIRSFADDALPFATMKHANDKRIPIEKPQGARNPVGAKICQATPTQVSALGTPSTGPVFTPGDPFVPWPDAGRPFFQIDLAPQVLVTQRNYRKVRVDLVVEVCERFCDHPFRTRGGEVYDSWKNPPGNRPMEVCQWRR